MTKINMIERHTTTDQLIYQYTLLSLRRPTTENEIFNHEESYDGLLSLVC